MANSLNNNPRTNPVKSELHRVRRRFALGLMLLLATWSLILGFVILAICLKWQL